MRKAQIVGLLAVCGWLAGCSLANVMHDADSANVNGLNDLQKDQVVLVGRIELAPAMGKDEVVIETNGSWMPDSIKAMLKEANLYIGEAPGPKQGEPAKGAYDDVVKAPFNGLFYARLDQGTSYLQVMSYVTRYNSQITQEVNSDAIHSRQKIEKAYMRIDAPIIARPGDQVLYIGSLKFKRDGSNKFKGLQVIDNSASDFPAIREKLGDGVKIRKVLVTAR